MRIPFPFIPPLLALCALSGCGDSPETLFAKAQEDFSAEDYKAARSQLIAALDEQPGNHRMLILLARTQLQLGDPDGAENVLGRLDRAGAKGPEVQRIRARVALMRKAPDKALALMGNDDTLEALRIRADAYLALGDDGKAKAAFERGMAKGDDPDLAGAYARFALAQNDLVLADRIRQRLQRMAPNSFETQVLAGDIAAARGQVDKAIAAYRAVVAAFPDRVEPLLALANQLDAKGQVDEAAKQVDAAAKLDPDNAEAEDLKYQLLAEKGEWEKIRVGLQGREADLDPSSGLGMRYGEALLRLGFSEQARMLFKRATLLLPGNPYSRMMLGEAQLACGDPDDAWATLRPLAMSPLARPEMLVAAEKAARASGAPEADGLRERLDPARLKALGALLARGDTAVMRQDWAAVLDVYGRMLGDGSDPEVLKRMALGSSGLGRTAQAIGYADRALALAPDSPDFQFLAGHVRLQGGQDLATARRLLESAAAGDPGNPVIASDLRKAKAATG
ncbi:tetratricopeptide repeat protein [Novosphingobium colocasiae]|uniref:Tetratricopeptide repeat protein n=1 Tax=Novosphingobium colocasiae TaxID=1256513 RepID=A0A918PBY3_9SPHN|nr:tetratricopeptide repeat protein [Novosphingobium colocasiae]GGY97677.1 hypothetical protein GCM10011614_10930 [Novosphingobium colocasiae]